ncbi:FCS-Like Zinc finger 17-like [Impatiens glandulifera]|uniref:FCS-Like Zinc finger 17-like n=1 Tax=Impatiens glandulifera TaxID=253017 RepID=UPI001FB08286|nr:FCS-Like Zinc finger 17-like [Impatiens glandulifera]
MTIKRTRIGRSSSFSRISVLALSDDLPGRHQRNRKDPPPPPSKMAKKVRVEGSEHSILVVSSPPNQVNHCVPIHGFLDSCHFCKKKLLQNDEVFMYSTFLAFCSSECRDGQILVDNQRNKHASSAH